MTQKISPVITLEYLKASPRSFRFMVYDQNGLHPGVIRGVVTSKNVDDVRKKALEVFGEHLANPLLDYIFKVNPAEWSDDLPGIHQTIVHPVTKKKMTLHSAIMNLNDDHKWTREQIADWIETLDNVPTFAAVDGKDYSNINYSSGDCLMAVKMLSQYRANKEGVKEEW